MRTKLGVYELSLTGLKLGVFRCTSSGEQQVNMGWAAILVWGVWWVWAFWILKNRAKKGVENCVFGPAR